MANVRSSNSIYVDATGSLGTGKNLKVLRVLFTPDAANDELLLTDGSGGANKLYVRHDTAKTTQVYELGDGIVFPNEIYVTTITSGAKAVLLVAGTGA